MLPGSGALSKGSPNSTMEASITATPSGRGPGRRVPWMIGETGEEREGGGRKGMKGGGREKMREKEEYTEGIICTQRYAPHTTHHIQHTTYTSHTMHHTPHTTHHTPHSTLHTPHNSQM